MVIWGWKRRIGSFSVLLVMQDGDVEGSVVGSVGQ